jgi:hypothetical protein
MFPGRNATSLGLCTKPCAGKRVDEWSVSDRPAAVDPDLAAPANELDLLGRLDGDYWTLLMSRGATNPSAWTEPLNIDAES